MTIRREFANVRWADAPPRQGRTTAEPARRSGLPIRVALPLLLLCALPIESWLQAQTIVVRTPDELRTSLPSLQNGARLKIGPGEYPGNLSVRHVENLTVEALDPQNPPLFKGGGSAWHFSRCPHLTLRNLRVDGQSGNGLNLDDGGQLDSPISGITLEGIEVSNIGPQGNCDGIKCSGLSDATIRKCTVTGWGGQAIDLVGCHHVLVSECKFVGKPGFSATAGVQTKGGSSEIVVEKSRFVDAGQRPLNVGGSTGLAFFRPQSAKQEASQIVVRDNVIEGGLCAAAFVGVDGAQFHGNTILYPKRWVFRILQETTDARFVPCRQVEIRDNRIVFRRAEIPIEINIGGGTAAETFRFANNRWFAEDRPQSSKPKLPSTEADGTYGVDPRRDR